MAVFLVAVFVGVWLFATLTRPAEPVGPVDPGVYCYVADDSALIHVRLTLDSEDDISGISMWSVDRGRTFVRTISFQGSVTRGATRASMILDVSWLSEGELIETKESWTFVEEGFRTGNRIYRSVDCSEVESTFTGRG